VVAEWIEPTAEVNCTDVLMEHTHNSGSNFSIGTTEVVYTATSGAGKISTCSFNVVVAYEELDFDVEQLLTPDGDGINDQWKIPNLEKFKDNKVVIVDRWGSVVFQATGYNNENVVWRGTSENGVAAPTGTYYYTISVRFLSEVREKRGFVELIR
jgi:gliding motility-associated-like protein